MAEADSGSLAERYASIRSRIPPEVTLIAVTKKHPWQKILELYRLGHRDFGENYVQELLEKAEALHEQGCSEIRWHFIGHLQTNKVKTLLPWISCIHTIDSDRLARELARRSAQAAHSESLQCFIEVNIDAEESKDGVSIEGLPALVKVVRSLPELRLLGLMAIPSKSLAQTSGESAFLRLRTLARKEGLPCLSMGMSEDFEEAIQAGATHVRVGTALLGQR